MVGHLSCAVKLCDLTTGLVTYIAVKLYTVWPYRIAGHLYCTVKFCDLTTGLVTYIVL